MDRVKSITGVFIILITGPVLGLLAHSLPLSQSTIIVNSIENAQRLEQEAKALEAVLEEGSRSRTGADLTQTNDLSRINLDYDNTESADESDANPENLVMASPARVRRTIGRLYCSIFFRENRNDCPLRSGRIRSLLFPSWAPQSTGQQYQAQVNLKQQPYKTENDFWLSYLGNNETGVAVNFTAVSIIPTPTTTPRPVWGLGQRRPFGSSMRRLFPRLYSAFNQGYQTGSGTGVTEYGNGKIESGILDSSNRNANFSFLKALNPFTHMRNFLGRRTSDLGNGYHK